MEITIYKCSREVCPRMIEPLAYANDKILYSVNHCGGLCKLVIDDDKWDRNVDYTYKSIISNYDLFEYEKGYLLGVLTKFKQFLEED